ncbi:MAG: CoA pyrophosphatase [Ignavibacteria bacterium]|nr:CoA pyrophosphatase [Ignavibacteria bacterium]
MKDHLSFIEYLIVRLQLPLPGWEYQQRMSPYVQGRQTLEPRLIPPDAKQTSVAALLFPGEKGSELIFTMRSNNVSHHKGQICFPGGKSEERENIMQTALRETHEELGIPREQISVIGNLSSLFVPPSHSMMHVIVGHLSDKPIMNPNPMEVEEVFSIALHDLAFVHEVQHITTLRSPDMEVLAPCWNIHPVNHLWGATAMCVSELIGLYQDFIGINVSSD